MLKVILPGSWDHGETPVSQVRMASRGLFGADYQNFVKRAGEEAAHFVKHCQDLDLKHQTPVHVIAMGATESIGPNRNGDGFKEASLRKYTPTFEKFAKVYRHHKNKSTDPHYGLVKKAYYNERMRRTELLLLLNKTKEAAAKYGGQVADEELETLESGDDLPVSMSCKIAYDVCSVCDNKAKDRDAYCESVDSGGSCPGFGCKYGLTKVSSDGHIQHVDNPHPVFFDISSVYRPADRIAFGNVADYLVKAAGAGQLGGAKLAELWNVSAGAEIPELDGVAPVWAQTLVTKLARVEQNEAAWRPLAPFFSYQESALDRQVLGKPGDKLAAAVLDELTHRKVCLSPSQFLGWLGVSQEKIAEVKALLPGVFLRLSRNPSLLNGVNLYKQAAVRERCLLGPKTLLGVQKLAQQAFTQRNLQQHVASSVLRKTASVQFRQPTSEAVDFTKTAAGHLASAYLGYVLDFLAQQPQTDDLPLTMNLVVAQNHI